jgi:hypothetical protein
MGKRGTNEDNFNSLTTPKNINNESLVLQSENTPSGAIKKEAS